MEKKNGNMNSMCKIRSEGGMIKYGDNTQGMKSHKRLVVEKTA